MGGYVDVMVGIVVDESDFFEVVNEDVVLEDKWDGEGPVPKFHPDTGEQLRLTKKVRKLQSNFSHLETELDASSMRDRWRDGTYKISMGSLSRMLPLGLERTCTPGDCSGWVLGDGLWGSGDLDEGGADVDEYDGEVFEKALQEVRTKLEELGIDREPKVCFMTGWW